MSSTLQRTRLTLALALSGGIWAAAALGAERSFTYTFEPETLPRGGIEFQQWVTLRTQRTKEIGQQNFNQWEFRQELEHGVTDRYTIGLYLNTRHRSYRDPLTDANSSRFRFEGLSVENRYQLLNPAEHPVGLTLFVQPTYSGDMAALEQRLILGQRHGGWKWSLNLGHETRWEDNFHSTEGKVEGSLGAGRDLGHYWFLGIEARSVSLIPDYERWESTAVYLGPVVSHRRQRWWATLSILPQIYGANFGGDPDGSSQFDLVRNERVNLRLIIGIHF